MRPGWREIHCDVDQAAVFVKPDGLELLNPLSRANLGQEIIFLLLAVSWNDAANGLPQHFLFAVSRRAQLAASFHCHRAIKGLADDRIEGGLTIRGEESNSVLSFWLNHFDKT